MQPAAETLEGPRFPSLGQAVLLLLGGFAVQTALAMPVAAAGFILHQPLLAHPLTIGLINIVAFGGATGFGVWFSRRPWREVLPLTPVPMRLYGATLFAVLGLGILCSELDNAVRYVLPPPRFLAELFASLSGGGGQIWASFFTLAVVAPVTEELLLRGVVLGGFVTRYRAGTAIALSSLLFAALHMNPWQFFTAALLGGVLGWCFVRTGSLIPCLLGHAVLNAVVVINPLLPFQIRGFNTGDPFSRTVEFQPLWFNATGAILLLAGLWLFHRWAGPPQLGLSPIPSQPVRASVPSTVGPGPEPPPLPPGPPSATTV